MRAATRVFLLAAAMALAACGGGSDEVDVPFTAIPSGYNPLFPYPEATYTIHDDAQWSSVWATFHAGWEAPPARPVVDFAVDMVVGLSNGYGPSGCDGLRITAVTDDGEQLHVTYARNKVPANVDCTTQVVPLVDFVKIPASNKPVVFQQAS